MDNQIPRYLTQARAAYLLGLPVDELARISQEAGIGHLECAGNKRERFFTYEELEQICVFTTHQDAVTH
jgi:hypothetical protein